MVPSTSTLFGYDVDLRVGGRGDVVHPATFAVPLTGGMLFRYPFCINHQRLFSGDTTEPAWASKPYKEPRPNMWIRREEVDPSMYEVPLALP